MIYGTGAHRQPADDGSLDGARPQCGIRPDASRSHG